MFEELDREWTLPWKAELARRRAANLRPRPEVDDGQTAESEDVSILEETS
jgi:hypothetical protein